MILTPIAAVFLAASLCPPAASAAADTNVANAAVQLPTVGGFRAADLADERVRAAAQFAAAELGSELGAIESAEQQVVAGMNYRLVIRAAGGSRYRVVVHQPLRGERQLRAHERLDAASDD